MDSVSLQEIRERAEAYDKTLQVDDPRLRMTVLIRHQDGSTLQLIRAFLMEMDEWIICFSEHHGVFVYHEDDVETAIQYERVYTIEKFHD